MAPVTSSCHAVLRPTLAYLAGAARRLRVGGPALAQGDGRARPCRDRSLGGGPQLGDLLLARRIAARRRREPAANAGSRDANLSLVRAGLGRRAPLGRRRRRADCRAEAAPHAQRRAGSAGTVPPPATDRLGGTAAPRSARTRARLAPALPCRSCRSLRHRGALPGWTGARRVTRQPKPQSAARAQRLRRRGS